MLCENVVHDVAKYICQAEVATGVAVGQLLVVESQEVQEGGVQVVHGWDRPHDALVRVGVIGIAQLLFCQSNKADECLPFVVRA